MLVIRLRRKGKKNQPFFRIIVIDKRRTAKGGNAVEILGNIDPLTKRKNLKKDRILYWISKGAKPSASVHNLLVSEKIIDAKKINVSKKPKSAKSSASAEATAGKPVAAKPEVIATSDVAPTSESATPEVKPVEPTPTESPKELAPKEQKPPVA